MPWLVAILFLLLLAYAMCRSFRRGRAGLRSYLGMSRLSRGRCPQCNYSFAGRLQEQCPDCGYGLSKTEFEHIARLWDVLQRSETGKR